MKRRPRKRFRTRKQLLLAQLLAISVVVLFVGAVALVCYHGYGFYLWLLAFLLGRKFREVPPLEPSDVELFPWEYHSPDDPGEKRRKREAWDPDNGGVSARTFFRSVGRSFGLSPTRR